MNSSKIIVSAFVVLLASLSITEGISPRSIGVEMHCRCIQKESRFFGRLIEKVEIIPASSHCEETEIIATLKKSGEEVCLNPEAPWVKKVIQRMMSNNERR